MPDGSWASVFRHDDQPYTEAHPYTYVLKSGEVQKRTATVSKRRHILGRRWLSKLGWPATIRESIDIAFDDEVGERTGSWKGGTIGCGYDLRRGETLASQVWQNGPRIDGKTGNAVACPHASSSFTPSSSSSAGMA